MSSGSFVHISNDMASLSRIKRQSGFTLIELLIASMIGLLMLGGLYSLQIENRQAFDRNSARGSMLAALTSGVAMLNYDLRMAGHWAEVGHGLQVNTQKATRQPLLASPGGACGAEFALSFGVKLQALDQNSLCNLPYRDPTSDVLAVRYASSHTLADANLQSGVLYLRSWIGGGQAFVGAVIPQSPNDAVNRVLHSYLYYVASGEASATGLPTLVRLSLVGSNNGQYLLEPVMEGVEGFQVQFALRDCPERCDETHALHRYVNPGHVLAPDADAGGALVGMLRYWLLARSAQPLLPRDAAYDYRLGNAQYSSQDRGRDRFGRLLIRQTVWVRNER